MLHHRPGLAVDEAGPPADRVVEVAVEVAGVDARVGRRAVVEQVERVLGLVRPSAPPHPPARSPDAGTAEDLARGRPSRPSARSAPGRRGHRPGSRRPCRSTSSGWLTSWPSTATTRYGALAQATWAPLSVLTSRTRTRWPGFAATGWSPVSPLIVCVAVVEVGDRQHVDDAGLRRPRVDHDAAEQAAADLLVGHLVGVVPVGAGVRRHPAVGVVLARLDRVLGDPGDAVLGVGHVDPVPVQGDPALDVVVVHVAPRPGRRPWPRSRGPGEVPLSV